MVRHANLMPHYVDLALSFVIARTRINLPTPYAGALSGSNRLLAPALLVDAKRVAQQLGRSRIAWITRVRRCYRAGGAARDPDLSLLRRDSPMLSGCARLLDNLRCNVQQSVSQAAGLKAVRNQRELGGDIPGPGGRSGPRPGMSARRGSAPVVKDHADSPVGALCDFASQSSLRHPRGKIPGLDRLGELQDCLSPWLWVWSCAPRKRMRSCTLKVPRVERPERTDDLLTAMFPKPPEPKVPRGRSQHRNLLSPELSFRVTGGGPLIVSENEGVPR